MSSPSSSSSSSSPSDDKSVWEILESVESKLIDSLHSTSDILLPQIVETSNGLYNQVESLTKQLYDKSSQINLGSGSDYFPTNFFSSNRASPNPVPAINVVDDRAIVLSIKNPESPWYRRILRPRYLLVAIGVFFTSRFALDCLLSTSQFQNFLRSHSSLRRSLPRWLTARAKLNARLNRPRYSTGRQTRLEAIIVLGADPGSPGYHLSLHLISIGFIVIASVSRLESVAELEREGLGWVRALVLDPTVGQSNTFNRSLAASLSLQFPLNSAGDGFASGKHRSSLVGLINCLPISFSDPLKPVENLEIVEDLLAGINRIAGVSLDIIKLVLPMLRNSIEKQGAEDAVVLTLFPTKTSSLSLPYISASLVANQTLESLMTTLRREMMISSSESKARIRIINERIGLYCPTPQLSSALSLPSQPPSLPLHLHPVYAPSLSRRVAFLNIPTTNLPILSTRGSPLSHLIQRVQDVVLSPNIRSGSSTSTGSEVWKYKLISTLAPTPILEGWLSLVERMNGWVRQKVVGEVDLESRETLERVIEKRNLSGQSSWKASYFSGNLRAPSHSSLKMKGKEQEQGSKDEVLEGERVVEGEGGEEVVNSEDCNGKEEDREDTKSCIDKGEQEEGNLQESFVGSEIDWKDNQGGEKVESKEETKDEEVKKDG